MEQHKLYDAKLKIIIYTMLFVMMVIIAALGIFGVIKINRQNYSYIKSMACTQETAVDEQIDMALNTIQTYATAKSEGVEFLSYEQYSFFDNIFYIDADYDYDENFKKMDAYVKGFQGKSGVEIDSEKQLAKEVSLLFYAPVLKEDKIAGILIGQYSGTRLSKFIETDCYGTQAISFLVTLKGDIFSATSGMEEHIGTNLFTDYHKNDILVSCSLDRVKEKDQTFTNLKNVLINGGSFGYTCKYNGSDETTYIKVLDRYGFAITKTFPYLMSQSMVWSEISLFVFIEIFLALIGLFILRPVIKRYEKQEVLKIAAQKADAANAAKSEFFSKMSHDMRTPLNGILGMAEIALRSPEDPQKLVGCIKKIKSSGHYLLGLINEVLDLSTIESGQMVLMEEEVDLNSIMIENKVIFDNLLIGKQLQFDIDYKTTHHNVIGDAVAIQKIILNLVSNAIKYTPEGGSIQLRFWEEEGTLDGYEYFCMDVQDSGIGMSTEFLDHIFEPYTREEDVRTSKYQGTGLGLNITKNLVDMMNGTINVQSEEGKGSTFTVKIQLRLNTCQETETNKPELFNIDSIDCSSLRCLLVEDNELNTEIAKEILSITEIQVEVAEDGEAALKKFEKSSESYYDIIFMDIQMPVMNGYEATRQIRQLDRADADKVPIIAMTANAYAQDVQSAYDAGMNAHIAKPIELQKLFKVITEYLEVKQK